MIRRQHPAERPRPRETTPRESIIVNCYAVLREPHPDIPDAERLIELDLTPIANAQGHLELRPRLFSIKRFVRAVDVWGRWIIINDELLAIDHHDQPLALERIPRDARRLTTPEMRLAFYGV